MAFKMNNPLKMVSALKHNGSPSALGEGIPTTEDTEHNTWHANKDWIEDGGDPNQKKVWNPKRKRWELHYQPIEPKKEEPKKEEPKKEDK